MSPMSSTVATDVAVMTLAAAADEWSTRYALQTCSVCQEGNPLMQEPAFRLAGKVVAIGALTLVNHELRKRNHKTAATILRWTAFSIWMGVAAHNVYLAKRYQ